MDDRKLPPPSKRRPKITTATAAQEEQGDRTSGKDQKEDKAQAHLDHDLFVVRPLTLWNYCSRRCPPPSSWPIASTPFADKITQDREHFFIKPWTSYRKKFEDNIQVLRATSRHFIINDCFNSQPTDAKLSIKICSDGKWPMEPEVSHRQKLWSISGGRGSCGNDMSVLRPTSNLVIFWNRKARRRSVAMPSMILLETSSSLVVVVLVLVSRRASSIPCCGSRLVSSTFRRCCGGSSCPSLWGRTNSVGTGCSVRVGTKGPAHLHPFSSSYMRSLFLCDGRRAPVADAALARHYRCF
jgi:hypothetical protein